VKYLVNVVLVLCDDVNTSTHWVKVAALALV